MAEPGRPDGKRVVKPPLQYMTPSGLIDAVRERPQLWNLHHGDYKDRNVSKILWAQIAKMFVSSSPHDAQKTWQALKRALSNHRNEYQKKHGASGSAAAPYKPYKYEARMAFLDQAKDVDEMTSSLAPGRRSVDVPAFEADVASQGDDNKENGHHDVTVSKSQPEPSRLPLKPVALNFNSPVHLSTPPKLSPQPTPLSSMTPVKFKSHPLKKESNKTAASSKAIVAEKSAATDQKGETPSKKDAIKRKKEAEMEEKRQASVLKLREQVELAKRAKLEDAKVVKRSAARASNTGDILTALEEALLSELQKEEDPNVSFAVSLAAGMKNLPRLYVRAFRLGALQLLGDLEDACEAGLPPTSYRPDDECNRKFQIADGKFGLSADRLRLVEAMLQLEPKSQLAPIGGVIITGMDLHTLRDKGWLNDQIINAYMTLINERARKPGAPSAFAFDTFFMTKLQTRLQAADAEMELDGLEPLMTWATEAPNNATLAEVCLIPAHRGNHWGMVVVKKKELQILYADSLNWKFEQGMSHVEKYVSTRTSINGWKRVVCEDMPQQLNSDDCGVLACQFARCVASGTMIDFSGAEAPALRRRMAMSFFREQFRSPFM